MNIQFAIKEGQLYVLEVNPRASRTVPFVAKAIGVPLAKLAAKVMTGMKLSELGFTRELVPKHWCVKEAVFPFVRFPGAVIALGPEMRSTGEVMGLDADLGIAFAKAQAAARPGLPKEGNVFLSVRDSDKPRAVEIARELEDMGFTIYSTSGTARILTENGMAVKRHREDQRGPPERGRHDQERPDPAGDQHPRGPDPAARRERHPGGGLRAQRLRHDDDHGRARGRRTASARSGTSRSASAPSRSTGATSTPSEGVFPGLQERAVLLLSTLSRRLNDHRNDDAIAAPSDPKTPVVEPHFGDRIRLAWERYGNSIYSSCGLIAAAVLARE